jgi:hypothetical protein
LNGGYQSIFVVAIIGFLASISAYFLTTYIRWEDLPLYEWNFWVGALAGGALMIIIGLICTLIYKKANIYKLFPWILVIGVGSYFLYFQGTSFHLTAFIIILAVSTVMQFLLTMYYGALASKAYLASGRAFGLSGAVVNFGIALGNLIVIFFERNPNESIYYDYAPLAAVFFALLFAALIIPMVREEYSIANMTQPPVELNELDNIYITISEQYALSPREIEILRRGIPCCPPKAKRLPPRLAQCPHRPV